MSSPKVFQIGSSIDSPETANDLDLIIVSDKPVDICVYTEVQWRGFVQHGGSAEGQRVVIYPREWKGNKLTKKVQLL